MQLRVGEGQILNSDYYYTRDYIAQQRQFRLETLRQYTHRSTLLR